MPPVYNVPKMKLWNRRSLLEQILLVILAVALIVIIALSITVGVRNKNGWGCPDIRDTGDVTTPSDGRFPVQNRSLDADRYCTTDECVITAAELISSRDASLDPCDDFYEYACHGWIKDSVLIGDGRLGEKDLMEQKINLRIKGLLEEEDITDELIPEHFDKARSYYSTCTNWVDREMDGASKLLSDVTYIGGYPALMGDQWNSSAFNYVTYLGRMWERGFDIRFLINVDLKPDPRNTSKLIIVLGQLDTSIFSSQIGRSAVWDLYTEYSTIFLNNLCHEDLMSSNCSSGNKENMTFEVKQAIQVERNIEQSIGPRTTKEMYLSSKNIMKLSQLQSIAKGVDWTSLIRFHLSNSRDVTGNDEILLAIQLESIRNLSRYLSELDSSDQGRLSLANYLMWRVVRQAAPDLDQRMLVSLFDMRAYLDGKMRVPDLWTLCLHETIRIFRVSVASAYLGAFHPDFSVRQKPIIQKMIQKIRTKLKRLINDTEWMDDITKREAQYKLDRLYVTIGYPDGLLSESRVNTYYKKMKVGDAHYENARNGNVFLQSKKFYRFGKPADRSEWSTFPVDLLSPTSTSYLATNNSAYISIGTIQGLFFSEQNPPYVNYGRLGPVIGELLAQALDYQGSLFDSNGNQRTWWRDETYMKFEASSQCMVAIFDNYFVSGANLSLNGQKLLLKNIAQELGVIDSYQVYLQQLFNGQATLELPGIDLNEKQLFWVAYATSLCEKVSQNFLLQQVTISEETPSRFRVNGPLSNNKNFIQDFNCNLGSKMNMDDIKCRVWS